jgi:hypothetical protein
LTSARRNSRTLSVALADLIHNFGDALTAIPLGLAFFFRSAKGERLAGLAVVLAIFISALVALGQTIERFIHPRSLSHLWLLAAAGIIGFVGNEIAAQVRLRAGGRLNGPALVADGNHARVDGFVSLGVLASAAVVSLGLSLADPIIGLLITAVILHITWGYSSDWTAQLAVHLLPQWGVTRRTVKPATNPGPGKQCGKQNAPRSPLAFQMYALCSNESANVFSTGIVWVCVTSEVRQPGTVSCRTQRRACPA